MLEERGYRVFMQNEALQGAIGEAPPGWPSLPALSVASEDAESARRLVLEFQEQARTLASQANDDSAAANSVETDDDDHWADWPTCPDCGKRRQAVCDVCGQAGTDFPLADFSPAPAPRSATRAPAAENDDRSETAQAEDPKPLLLCPTCDEAFSARFYRRCAWCGHEADNGIDRPPDSTGRHEDWNPRVAAVGFGAAAILLGVFLMLWYLLRR